MIEDRILKVMAKKKIKPRDIYIPLGINRVNFYQAIKTSNLGNPTLQKILDFLEVEIIFSLQKK